MNSNKHEVENYLQASSRLAELRTRAGLSQGKLSKASGIHVMAISKIERGVREMDKVTLKTAIALADALGVVDLRELLPRGRKQAEDEEQNK